MRHLRRLWLLPLGVAVVALLAVVPRLARDGLRPGEARVEVAGRARVVRAGGTAQVVTGTTTLRPGDRFEQLEGRARFELADEVRLESRTGGAGDRPGTVLVMAATPRLVAGELLVLAGATARLEAGDAVLQVRRRGTADAGVRASLASGLGVRVYDGEATVDSMGAQVRVRRLRRVDVAAPGDVSRRPTPLRYRTDDRWDRRFLGDAIDLDRQIDPILTGYRAADGPDPRAPEQLRQMLPGLPRAGLRDLLEPVRRERSRGDVLVGAVIASLSDEPLAEAWKATFSFHADGATWGLVALDRGVTPAAVLDGLGRALERTDFAFSELASSTTDGGAAGGGDELATGSTGGPAAPGDGGPTAPAPGSGSTAPPGSDGGSGGGPAAPGGTGPPGTGAPPATGPGSPPPPGPAPPPPAAPPPAAPPATSPPVLPPITSPPVLPPITSPSTVLPPLTTPTTALPPITSPTTVLPPLTTPTTLLPPLTTPTTVLPPITTPTLPPLG